MRTSNGVIGPEPPLELYSLRLSLPTLGNSITKSKCSLKAPSLRQAGQAQERSAFQRPASHGSSPKTSHSERDWRWATRQLGQGESVHNLVHKLEQSRQDKPSPGYYARLTVTRAYARYALSRGIDPQEVIRTITAHAPRATEDGEAYARKTVSETQRMIGSQRPRAQAQAEPPQGNAQRLALRVTP